MKYDFAMSCARNMSNPFIRLHVLYKTGPTRQTTAALRHTRVGLRYLSTEFTASIVVRNKVAGRECVHVYG